MSLCIPRDEVLRYLGGAPETPELGRLVDSVLEELPREVCPRSAVRRVSLQTGEDCVEILGLRFFSRALASSLAGCESGYLIAATLGTQADMLLRRSMAVDLPRAAVVQAACAAMLEAFLDQLCGQLNADERENDLFLLPRFSPGYGDLPLSFQPFLMERLEMGRLGVRLTSGLMMAPSKSVTAVAGWRCGPPSSRRKCAACPNLACPYRDEEADHEIS